MTIFVSYEEANAFLFARNHFPDGTPNRWEFVAEFVRAREKLSQAGPTISFSCNGQQNFTSVKHLNLTKIDDCRTLDKLITNNYSKIFQRDLTHSLYQIECREECNQASDIATANRSMLRQENQNGQQTFLSTTVYRKWDVCGCLISRAMLQL